MELFYFKGAKPNFGDELNVWLWPKLIEGVWDANDSKIFLGIGSIIYNSFPPDKTKIVFGAGYGGYTPLPTIDNKWKFYFVRGKLTARALGIDESLGVGDAAILIRSCIKLQLDKRHEISFMPHWESTFDGNWKLACEYAGINYIDPCAPVEIILEHIQTSKLLITEAMHGAIVADALRVPWISACPIRTVHHMKWEDWASVLDIDIACKKIPGSSLLESVVHALQNHITLTEEIRIRGRFLINIAPEYFAEKAATALLYISKNSPPKLSPEISIERVHSQMLSKLVELSRDFDGSRILIES
jgi:succinoglycan biosynthesis protein ExoV